MKIYITKNWNQEDTDNIRSDFVVLEFDEIAIYSNICNHWICQVLVSNRSRRLSTDI